VETEAGFHSLTEAIDTTTPAGGMTRQMVGAFAEFKRPCSGNEPKPGWMPPAVPSSRHSSSLKSEGENQYWKDS
jgi:hypothetical protein